MLIPFRIFVISIFMNLIGKNFGKLLVLSISGQNENRNWSQEVKKAAKFTCKVCSRAGGDLASHHLESYHANPKLRLVLTNGVCLCNSCHKDFHKRYGNQNNTEKQFKEYCNERLVGSSSESGKIRGTP